MSMTFATDVIVDTGGNSIKTNKVLAPTASGGTTYGAGSSGQVLKSNGTNVYWASDNNSDTQVTQTNVTSSTTNEYRRVLLSASANNTTETAASVKSGHLVYNIYDHTFFLNDGRVVAPQYDVCSSEVTKAYYIWNKTDECIDFVFT